MDICVKSKSLVKWDSSSEVTIYPLQAHKISNFGTINKYFFKINIFYKKALLLLKTIILKKKRKETNKINETIDHTMKKIFYEINFIFYKETSASLKKNRRLQSAPNVYLIHLYTKRN